ncbi:MFS transporter [bacterium]|nr:MFS transporter [bacterium]
MNLLTAMTVVVLIVGGMGAALLGSVKLALARKLEMDEARVGGLLSVFGLTMIPVILSAGFITDHLGKQPVVIGGCVLVAAALLVLGTARTYWGALLGVVLLSAGWSAIVNVINPMAAITFGRSKAFSMNLACFCFGVGAFVTPLVVGFLLKRVGLTRALLALAGALAVPIVLAAVADYSLLAQDAAATPGAAVAESGIGSLLSNPIMWLCTLALLFYGPLEAATGAWTTTYLRDNRVSENRASWLLSAFWLGYTCSRLAAALGADATGITPEGERMLILVLGVAATLALWGIVIGRGPTTATVMVIVAGIVYGPIFPTIMAVLLGHFDPGLHGRAVGLMFAIGGIGTVTIPAAMGAYAKRTSVQRGFLIAVGSAAALSIVALILVLKGVAPAG